MLKITNLVKAFRDGRATITACDHISLEVPAGKFFTLLGPSGCGKTTTLRLMRETNQQQLAQWRRRFGTFFKH